MNATTTIRVSAPFACALLHDLREPSDDSERDHITDLDQLAYEAALDICIQAWTTALDGDGERTLPVLPNGPCAQWLYDQLAGSVVEGLTARLDGSTAERKAVVEALAGWVDVMAQLENAPTINKAQGRE